MDQAELKAKIRTEVVLAVSRETGKKLVTAAVSGRHMHLCRADIDALFGAGYELSPLRPLSQPGQFAAKETVSVSGPKGTIQNIRVLGPARPETQVELSVTDCYKLGIPPAVRMSGDLVGTPGARLSGPAGEVNLSRGVEVAARHLHLSAAQAAAYGLSDGQAVRVKTFGVRAVVYENVAVRSGEGHDMELHIDTDEANAAGIQNGDILEIV